MKHTLLGWYDSLGAAHQHTGDDGMHAGWHACIVRTPQLHLSLLSRTAKHKEWPLLAQQDAQTRIRQSSMTLLVLHVQVTGKSRHDMYTCAAHVLNKDGGAMLMVFMMLDDA